MRFGDDARLWPVSLTVLVLDVGTGSASDELHGTLLLPAIGCRVQRSVTQQVRAVDVWRLFPAELQPRQRSTAVEFFWCQMCLGLFSLWFSHQHSYYFHT